MDSGRQGPPDAARRQGSCGAEQTAPASPVHGAPGRAPAAAHSHPRVLASSGAPLLLSQHAGSHPRTSTGTVRREPPGSLMPVAGQTGTREEHRGLSDGHSPHCPPMVCSLWTPGSAPRPPTPLLRGSVQGGRAQAPRSPRCQERLSTFLRSPRRCGAHLLGDGAAERAPGWASGGRPLMTLCGLHPSGGAEAPGIRQFPFPRHQDQTPCARNAPAQSPRPACCRLPTVLPQPARCLSSALTPRDYAPGLSTAHPRPLPFRAAAHPALRTPGEQAVRGQSDSQEWPLPSSTVRVPAVSQLPGLCAPFTVLRPGWEAGGVVTAEGWWSSMEPRDSWSRQLPTCRCLGTPALSSPASHRGRLRPESAVGQGRPWGLPARGWSGPTGQTAASEARGEE